MRLYVLLFLAAVVLQAHAASIPINVIPESGAKLIVTEEKEEPVNNNTSENELIVPANVVNEVANELRSQTVGQIPVKVVSDPKPSLKTEQIQEPEKDIVNEIPKDDEPAKPEAEKVEKPEENKKPSESSISDISDFDDDVEEPAGQADDDQSFTISIIKDALQNAHQSIQLSVDSFSQTFQTWIKDQSALLPSETQISNVKSIVETNIGKLNDTLRGYFSAGTAAKLAELPDDSVNHIEVVETDLKNLETNFENEVKSAFDTERADNATTSNNTSEIPPGFQNIQQVIQEGFNNISLQMQQLFNQNSGDNSSNNIWVQWGQNFGNFFNQQQKPSSGAQSDEGATNRPNIFQSIQNLFSPPFQAQQTVQGGQPNTQADQPAQPNRPILNAIQNNPIVQSISGVFNRQPNKPLTPTSPQPDAVQTYSQEGANIVPETPPADVVEEQEPAQATATTEGEKDKPVQPTPILPVGPIRQVLQKNPIVQGIAGAVQRIQTSITNPEKPRKIGHIVSHIGHGGHGGHGGSGNTDKVSGIDSARCVTELTDIASPIKEDVPEQPKKEPESALEQQEPKKEQEEPQKELEVKEEAPKIVAEKTE